MKNDIYRSAPFDSPTPSKTGLVSRAIAWITENYLLVCTSVYLFSTSLTHILLLVSRSPSAEVSSSEMQGHTAFLLFLGCVWFFSSPISGFAIAECGNKEKEKSIKLFLVAINLHFFVCLMASTFVEFFGK